MKNVQEVISILEKEFPDAKIALNFETTWQLLVAVILSAQCTDERVNKVTPPLFKELPTVEDFAEVEIEKLEKLIYSTGFYRSKSKNIKAAATRIVDEFGGKVPGNMDDLLSLGGVARKTANVMMWSVFGESVGIVVDTHVIRISGHLGWTAKKLVKVKNAVKIEQRLIKIIPKDKWGIISHLLILHGRKTCIARRPKCTECPLSKICPASQA